MKNVASGVALLTWASVAAGLITERGRRHRAWPWTRRRTMSDEELRELVGIYPKGRPAT